MKPDRIQFKAESGRAKGLGTDVRYSVLFARLVEAMAFLYSVAEAALETGHQPDFEVRHEVTGVVVVVELAVAAGADAADVHRQLQGLLERGAAMAGFQIGT